jgi:CDP-glycerol:poly(glycerophosphate) glycerophosphotransferase
MDTEMKSSVLFTGYAPVHFLCFRPLYERLRALPGVEVFFSGGLRTATSEGFAYDGPAMYQAFGIPEQRILSMDVIKERRFDVVFSANKRLITPPETIGTKIQIFHGVSFRNRGMREENLAYDFLFVIGPYMRRKFIETGILPEDDPRVVEIGLPKTDRLVNGSFDREALLARYGFDGRRPVLLYAPTGEAYNSLETMGIAVIERLAKSARYDLLIKPHDHPKNATIDWFSRLASFEDAHTRVVRELDVIPLLALADLLITDASSVANEFALLDRPLVFLDVPELLQRSRDAGANLDLATWGRRGGVVVERPEEVCEAVARSLAEPERDSAVRTALARDLFYNPGHATDAAVEWFSARFGIA